MSLELGLRSSAQNAMRAPHTVAQSRGHGLDVTVIGIALGLGGVGRVVSRAAPLAGGFAEVRGNLGYLVPGVGLDRAEALARELRNKTGVESVQLIPADTAVAELSKDPGFGALAALDQAPCHTRLVVRPLAATDSGTLKQLAAEVGKAPDVDLVKLDLQWVERLNAALDFPRRLGLITGGLLIAAVVIVVGNTIRLDIQNRSAEIEVAKLLGATDAFVRRPFLYLGLWYGILGGLVAMLILSPGFGRLAGRSAPAGLYGSSFALGGRR